MQKLSFSARIAPRNHAPRAKSAAEAPQSTPKRPKVRESGPEVREVAP
jgi:hypothetical protein